MNNRIGKKQNTTNAVWIQQMEHIEEIISKHELDALVEETVNNIKITTKNKKSAYAWSAGKDSVVLGYICEKADIKDCMIGVCDLEYPAFMRWIEDNKPFACEVINTHQNLEWLKEHEQMLFPKDSSTASRWFAIVQHRAQRVYAKNNNIEILLLGRRKADGNYVGRGDNKYEDKNGFIRYSPLSNWSHEQILACIHYYDLKLPPIYNWKNGYVCGTHPWPARQWTGSIENGWSEVYDIDKNIVESAALYLDSAKSFLEKRGDLS